MKKVFKLDFLGRDLIVEIGEMAKQTDGATDVCLGYILTGQVEK